MTEREHGLGSGGAFVWFMQRVSGVILLLALFTHFWALHFFSPAHGEITYESVMRRLSHPAWRTIDLLFLVVGLYHGMNGIMIVLHDYVRQPRVRTFLVGLLWMATLWFLIMGSMTILGLAGGNV